MCLFNKLHRNPKYKPNKKNGFNPPTPKDGRVAYVPIGCGDCMECRRQKAQEWRVRLSEDIKTNTNGKFITLTFSNESIKELSKEIDATGYARDNAIATLGIRRFTERWRKKYTKTIRHWLVTELGHQGTENVHMHGIIWTNETYETIEKFWKYGFIWPRPNERKLTYVNGKTVNYCVKYVNKIDYDHQCYKPIILTSNGIGGNYMKSGNHKRNKFKGVETRETYITSTGHEMGLPIYWRNKIYTDEEREQLWLNRLDKKERWINGERIDISNGEEAYEKAQKWHQEQNKMLGYGNGTATWDKVEYENAKRNMMHEHRVNNTKPIKYEKWKTHRS